MAEKPTPLIASRLKAPSEPSSLAPGSPGVKSSADQKNKEAVDNDQGNLTTSPPSTGESEEDQTRLKSLGELVSAAEKQYKALQALKTAHQHPEDNQQYLQAADAYAEAMAKLSVAQERHKKLSDAPHEIKMNTSGKGGAEIEMKSSPQCASKPSPSGPSPVASPLSNNLDSTATQSPPKHSMPTSPDGAAGSGSGTASGHPSEKRRDLVVMLEKVSNIPNYFKAFYKMDPSIRVHVSDAEGKRVSTIASWPPKKGTTSPVWNTPRRMQVWGSDTFASGYLHIHLHLPNLGKVASAQVSMDVLTMDHTVGSVLGGMKDKEVCTVTFRRVKPIVGRYKWLFLLRHAESEWNWAKANKSITKLVSQVDHPLTERGLNQARSMRSTLTKVLHDYNKTLATATHRSRRSSTPVPPLPISRPPPPPTPPKSARASSPEDPAPPTPLSLPLTPDNRGESKSDGQRQRNKPVLSIANSKLCKSGTGLRGPSAKDDGNPRNKDSGYWEMVGADAEKKRGKGKRNPESSKGSTASTSTEKEEEVPVEYLRRLRYAEGVLCSPLTRAVQTCVIALAKHPMWLEDRRKRITLFSSIREKRGWGSLDTQGRDAGATLLKRLRALMEGKCQGKHIGDTPLAASSQDKASLKSPSSTDAKPSDNDTKAAAANHSRSEGRESGKHFGGHHQRVPESWLVNRIDVNDCTDKWWNTSKETNEALSIRINEFINWFRYSSESSLIVVGHSAFFREFVQNHASPTLCQKKPALVLGKLMNCEMRGLRFDLSTRTIEDIVSIAVPSVHTAV